MKKCSIEWCDNKFYSKSLCRKHYDKSRVFNDGYYSWQGIKSRCLNTNDKDYKYYGGRGIKVCDEWINSFESFINDMGERPSKSHSIDRINNNEGYNKFNCKWSNKIDQAINRRRKSTNTSGTTGVVFSKRVKKYQAYISVDRKRKHLGTFINIEDAIQKRKDAEQKYW